MTEHDWAVQAKRPGVRDVPSRTVKERCSTCGALRLRIDQGGGRSETTGFHPHCEDYWVRQVMDT